MDIESLKRACRGPVIAPDDARFPDAIHGTLWNRLIPDRAPQVVVQAADEQDIIAAIRFARANGVKVVVRGGGHNWCQPTLRNGGILIDLQNFTDVVSIDAAGRRAVIRPIISNRDIQRALNPLGLAFPTGHCPQVKASGYFLGGGMAWNPTVWGYGAESLEAVELVTAQGELITASETENPDVFWAARGAGSSFFGVVTKYVLKLHPLPKAIHGSTYFFRLDDAPAIGHWLGDRAPTMSPSVELSQFIVQAPPALKDAAAAQNGWVCMVTATAFEETPEAAGLALQPLEQAPIRALSRSTHVPLDFEQLFDASGALFPEGVRSRVEATYSNHSPGALMEAILPLWPAAPSATTVFLLTIFCGPDVPGPQRDMARSMTAKVYGGPWTMWRDAEADQANADWHLAMTAALEPYKIGYYISESNTADQPDIVPKAFTPEKWARLRRLRDAYDPDRVFFDYREGFDGP
ncbi:FAD-binding oxidoreductase [Methylobacterium sp. NEAU 140]|uniref:FAD-binding oxidoreductase n=1 Tax=Methylobacterium sp. NEAU 140 TaxID=3064945 RepID=UPI0027375DA2|nr:FAD-binding oxidoreductase [Methylobacterium sp. NEAU 140]MDP4025361.1 FAD-binding oxidoreductase [Methylobacterium sp. NEAU 140]